MVSLVEIAPMRETVTIRGTDLTVRGLSADAIVHLLTGFPELQKMFVGKQLESDAITTLVNMGGRMLASVIAAGCGELGNEEAIAAAQANLSAGECVEILEVVFRLTFPQGVANFIERLSKAAKAAGVVVISVPGMKSQDSSRSASTVDITKMTSGPTPPDNSEDMPTSSDENKQPETSN